MNDTTFHGNGKITYVPVVVNAKQQKPQTNADRIRSMTDEELAEWLGLKVSACNENEKCGNDYTCDACWLDWLREEVVSDG